MVQKEKNMKRKQLDLAWGKLISETHKRSKLGEQLKNLDVATFVHTVNDQTEVNDFISKGVGVYTDVFPTSTPLSLLK